jgi:hypothetical protein
MIIHTNRSSLKVPGALYNTPSPSHVATTSTSVDLVQGGEVAIYPAGSIAVDSTVGTSYTPKSFYLACAAESVANAGVILPDSCTIAATGYYPNGTMVPSQTFSWAPDGDVNLPNPGQLITPSQFTLQQFSPDFVGVQSINLSIAGSGTALLSSTVVYIDNFVHEICEQDGDWDH